MMVNRVKLPVRFLTFILLLFFSFQSKAIMLPDKMNSVLADTCPVLINPIVIGAVCEVSLGFASITAVGIDTPFTYSWTPANSQNVISTDSFIVDVNPGQYQLIVSNNQGNCSDTLLFNIPLLNVPQINITQILAEHCGQLNGSASLTINGGTGPYIIHWFPVNNPGDTIAQGLNADNMPAGVYRVQVYNADNTCMQQTFITIPAVAPPRIQLINLINADCDQPNGSLTVGIDGNGGPFQFNWYSTISPDVLISTDSILSGVSAGTYIVEVSNSNGECTQTAMFTVQSENGPQINNLTVFPSGCGLNNGSAAATITSAHGEPVSFWINPVSGDTLAFGSAVQGLAPGIYNLVTSNADSTCQVVTGVNITETGSVEIAEVLINPAGCDSDGGFATVVFQGDSVHLIEWFNLANPGTVISNDTTAMNLRAGFYLVRISNVDGSCPTEFEVEIPASNNLQPVYPFVFNTTCGRENGRASIITIGGTEPLTYLWIAPDGSVVSTDSFVTELAPMEGYRMTVQDAAGCIYSYMFDIDESFGPMFDLSPDTTILPGSFASLNATNFNTQNYSIQWAPPINLSCNTCESTIATPTITTEYALTMVDSNNCSITQFVTVFVEGTGEGVFLPSAFTPNRDGINDVISINGVGIMIIDEWNIYSKSGALVYQVRNFPVLNPDMLETVGWDGRINGRNVEPGPYVYTLQVTFESNRRKFKSGSFTLIR